MIELLSLAPALSKIKRSFLGRRRLFTVHGGSIKSETIAESSKPCLEAKIHGRVKVNNPGLVLREES